MFVYFNSSVHFIQMWSVEYVQVPKENQKTASTTNVTGGKSPVNDGASTPPESALTQSLSRKGSCDNYAASGFPHRRESCDSYSDGKSAADILRDFKDPDYLTSTSIDCELASSGDYDSPLGRFYSNFNIFFS